MNNPEILRKLAFDMQVCVPEQWTDDEVKVFADKGCPCGTTGGWTLRKGDTYRYPCDVKKGKVHLTLYLG